MIRRRDSASVPSAGVLCAGAPVVAAPAAAQTVGRPARRRQRRSRSGIRRRPLRDPPAPRPSLTFRPNLEIGFGDDVTLAAINFEFAYWIPLEQHVVEVCISAAGPAINIYAFDGGSDVDGGFNILLGLQHRRGLFTELKVGAMDSPDLKFAVGYVFGR